MNHSDKESRKREPSQVRIPHSVSFPVAQDQWLSNLLGEKGNLSAFIQGLVDLAREGKVDVQEVMRRQKDSDVRDRAVAYLKAKEAGMLFEEDVSSAVARWLGNRKGLRVVRGRIHNGANTTFVADFSIERANGEVVASVVCKSSPRADRLQLALAEAMIGRQKTGKPVIITVPYFIEESGEVLGQFKTLGYPIAELNQLGVCLDKTAGKQV